MVKTNMKAQVNQVDPEAWIAIQKNRQKIHSSGGEKVVYLQDQQEFEIELHNPKNHQVLVKIRLNGSYISDRGIILDPGQRWFLDRYIDENGKLLFSTYDVKDNSVNRKAIEHNGSVEIEFYDEILNNYSGNTNWPYTYNYHYHYDYNPSPWINPWITTTPNIYYTTNIGSSGTISSNNFTLSNNASNDTLFAATADVSTNNIVGANFSVAGSIETGRVKRGEESDQNFIDGYGNFYSWASKTISFKLLPLSRKPVKKTENRSYCTGCSKRIRKSTWSFCPSCGTEIEQ